MAMHLALVHTSQITITFVPLLFLFLVTLSQSQVTPATPTMAECGARLFVLAPCTPFVQGQSPGPTQQCCDNLMQVYNTQRSCLCLFLNGTILASMPLNSTLALRLPAFCRAPTVAVAPRPSNVRFGLGKSSSAYKLASDEWGVTVAVIFLLLEKLL
ncbi:Protein YLS3 [Bienertia sinuspersici]